MRLPLLFAAALLVPLAAKATTITINPASDFFTTKWASGAPYVHDTGRDHLGISGPNPYDMDPAGSWAEVTYLTFDPLSFSGITSPVTSAVLTFTTTARLGIATSLINVSAHYLSVDPTTSIDPMLPSSSPGSFFDFQNNHIGAIIDTVPVDSYDVYQLDLTVLVNEWISNGDSNVAYAIALAGLEGNDAYPEGWAAIVNSGYEGAPVLTVTTVPEPGSSLLISLGAITLLARRRRLRRSCA